MNDAFARRRWPWLLLAVLLLGLAIRLSAVEVERDSFRYLFVLDITQSMNVADRRFGTETVTRLDYSKALVAAALSGLPCGSEAGLGVFTAHRTFVLFTPVETCAHFQPLTEMLALIDWRMAWEARSEVAKGLYSAIDATEHAGPDTQLVFLTDGHEAPPVNASFRAPFRREPGSVAGLIGGVGGAVPAPIPVIDEDGVVRGYWAHEDVLQVDVHSLGRPTSGEPEPMAGIDMAGIARRIALGQEHLSSLRESYLEELAARTGLDYVRLDSEAAFLGALQRQKYARRTSVATDVGWIPATLALVSLLWCFAPRRVRAQG